MKEYRVTLTAEEHQSLQDLIATVKKLAHAGILLEAVAAPDEPGWAGERLAEAVEVSVADDEGVRCRFVEHGLEAALVRKPQDWPSRLTKLDGRAEAHLVALACSKPSGRVDDATAGRQAGRAANRRVDLRRDGPPDA